MNAGHTCLFRKGFFTVYFGAKEDNAVTLPHSSVRKHAISWGIMEKSKKNPARKKIALELLHQRLGHISTRSLIAGDTDNVWEDAKLRIDPDPFCMKCKKGLDQFLALHLPRHWQYLQLLTIWYICALISDASILKQFSFFLDFFLDFSLNSPYFLP